MIPQDLIEFVKDKKSEVLPHRILYRDSDTERFRFGNQNDHPIYHAWIGEDHAAALLANWLDEELGKCATYKYETLQYAQTGVWAVFVDGDVKATSDNKLSALWQAYKKVKGIQ